VSGMRSRSVSKPTRTAVGSDDGDHRPYGTYHPRGMMPGRGGGSERAILDDAGASSGKSVNRAAIGTRVVRRKRSFQVRVLDAVLRHVRLSIV